MSSGSKVIDRRYIADHVKIEWMFRYNCYYVFTTLCAIFLCKTNNLTYYLAFIINFYDKTVLFMQIAFGLWIMLFLMFALFFKEPSKDNSNYSNYQLEFSKSQ